MIDRISANAAFGSPRATLHLPPLPQPLLPLLLDDELPQLPHDDPPDDDDELLPQLPHDDPPDDELLLQPPPPPPPDDELLLHPPPPPLLLLELDEHESQLPPQPFWLFELAHVLSHESELPQLGPEQLQLGEASQLALLSLHASPQLTLVERGGSLLVPASVPGPGYEPEGAP